jgi:Uma2 family endonuclease
MGTNTLITAEQYAALDEPAGLRYELSKGELIVTPSPMMFHNQIRDEVGFRLREIVRLQNLGRVTMETDFQLSEDTVRRPDVALIGAGKVALLIPTSAFRSRRSCR